MVSGERIGHWLFQFHDHALSEIIGLIWISEEDHSLSFMCTETAQRDTRAEPHKMIGYMVSFLSAVL